MDQETVYIYVLGTAGSGKSSFCKAFSEWASIQGFSTATVNLDPGAEKIPYEPDVDIRDWIKLTEIMKEHDLGPNGAQVVAADMVALNLKEIQEVCSSFRVDYVLVDTPGQIELFAFRSSSKITMGSLAPGRSSMVFLYDPILSSSPSGIISQFLLGAIVQFRFPVPMISALSKVDILDEERLDFILNWVENPEELHEAAMMEAPSMEREMGINLYRTIEELSVFSNLTPISNTDLIGFEDLYDKVQEIFMGGEDLQPFG